MIVAFIALLVAMGGTGYAAILLPANSVGAKQLKKSSVKSTKLANNAVTSAKIASNAVVSSKVKDGSLLKTDFAAGQLPAGAQGPQGPQGPQGAAGPAGTSGAKGADGSAVAYARVLAAGTLDAARTKNVTSVDHSVGPGIYCLHVSTTPNNIVASIDLSTAAPGDTEIHPSVVPTAIQAVCGSASTANAVVLVYNGALVDKDIYVAIN
jgi:hypothetical protein